VAKACLNGWRCATALGFVHLHAWSRWLDSSSTAGVTPLNAVRAEDLMRHSGSSTAEEFNNVD